MKLHVVRTEVPEDQTTRKVFGTKGDAEAEAKARREALRDGVTIEEIEVDTDKAGIVSLADEGIQ